MSRGDGRPVTAIVLAGGRSSRFGSDKLAADVEGRPLLARAIEAVASVADRVVVAGPRLPDGLAAGVPVSLVPDRDPDAGPLVALANALAAAGQRGAGPAIVVGGDMPGLVPAVLAAMLDHLTAAPERRAVVLELPGTPRRQVLPMAVRAPEATTAATAVLADGGRSLTALLDRLAAEALPAGAWQPLDPDARTLADVDTPADLGR